VVTADETPAFEGHPDRECGEHGTVGPHRAWCYTCTEWCYPDLSMACRGCQFPVLLWLHAEAAWQRDQARNQFLDHYNGTSTHLDRIRELEEALRKRTGERDEARGERDAEQAMREIHRRSLAAALKVDADQEMPALIALVGEAVTVVDWHDRTNIAEMNALRQEFGTEAVDTVLKRTADELGIRLDDGDVPW
jgi:hypothetical protein